jgi:hypothetical protein
MYDKLKFWTKGDMKYNYGDGTSTTPVAYMEMQSMDSAGNDHHASGYTAVALLLRCRYTVVTLLLRCCYTVVTLLLHCCNTLVTLLLHCCMDSASNNHHTSGHTAVTLL